MRMLKATSPHMCWTLPKSQAISIRFCLQLSAWSCVDMSSSSVAARQTNPQYNSSCSFVITRHVFSHSGGHLIARPGHWHPNCYRSLSCHVSSPRPSRPQGLSVFNNSWPKKPLRNECCDPHCDFSVYPVLKCAPIQIHVQSSAVTTRSSIVRYKWLQELRQNINQMLDPQKTPLPRPNGWTMGCLLWIFLKNLTAI